MCYSAMVKQNAKKLGLQFKARIDYAVIEDMLTRRLKDDSIKITKAFEASFDHPESSAEKKIHEIILKYREQKTQKMEEELFKLKKRLADAERKLEQKETKKALEDQRISKNKIKWNLKKLEDLKSKGLKPENSRIFPMTYAPIIVQEKGERLIKLARYHCRPADKPASIDFKYNGLYNARRDNLGNAFWKDLFGHKHGFFVVDSFFENVARHDYEKRPLQKGETEENKIIHFIPPHEMLVACLYDYWEDKKSKEGFYSFAALTDEPTPEITAAGHDRLIIALQEKNITAWLEPEKHSAQDLYAILDQPENLKYENELAG